MSLFAAGDILTADALNEAVGRTARMTSNQNFANAAQANVTQLVLPGRANTIYKVEAELYTTGDDVNGLATSWTYPAGATFANGQHSVQHNAAGGVVTAADMNGRGIALQASPSTTLEHKAPDTNAVVVILKGTLVMGANAGDLQLRASKVVNTSGTDTVILAGSTITIRAAE